MASYVAAYRIGTLVSTAGALFIVSGSGRRASTIGRPGAAMSRWPPRRDRRGDNADRDRSRTIGRRRGRHAAHAGDSPFKRVLRPTVGAFSRFPRARDGVRRRSLFVVLFKFTDALRRRMTAPFVIDLGFSRNEYAAIIKGVGLAATMVGGFAGGYIARAYPLAASLWIGGLLQAVANLAFSWQAVVGHDTARLTVAIVAGELHQRDRHGDLRRLPVGAVPQSAAHRHAIRAADRAGGLRPHLSVGGRGLYRGGDRLDLVLRRSARWPACRASSCSGGCSARAFREARAGAGVSPLASKTARGRRANSSARDRIAKPAVGNTCQRSRLSHSNGSPSQRSCSRRSAGGNASRSISIPGSCRSRRRRARCAWS